MQLNIYKLNEKNERMFPRAIPGNMNPKKSSVQNRTCAVLYSRLRRVDKFGAIWFMILQAGVGNFSF